VINSPSEDCFSPYILSVSFIGVRGEVLLHLLEEKRIYVSTGSACSAKKQGDSHVLKAIGLNT
jgi:cysteine desulfurase